MSFEELGPTFVKFGQLLATRPDIIPQDYIDEMSLLHDQAQALEFKTIAEVISQELGTDWRKYFKSISEDVLGAASIAQVHEAELHTGEKVVLKVQRPGIVEKINDDLNVLYFMAELIETHIPESRPYNPVGMVDEYFNTLALETNFLVEANNIRRFKENFHTQPEIVIPKVYFEYTTEKVLVMEQITGVPLSKVAEPITSEKLGGSDPTKIIELGLKAYLKMVFIDGFFHGDLHPGNFFVLPNNQIGLIDFGVVGRLNQKTQMSIVNMLVALSKEDYTRLAYEYVDLAPFTDHVSVDRFANELQSIIAPYYGLTLKNVNMGKILLSSSTVAAQHGLKVPAQLLLFFKSLISIESLGTKIQKDFDFLAFTLTQVNDVAAHFFKPTKFTGEVEQIFSDSKNFFTTLPRQMNLILRRINSPNYTPRLQVPEIENFRKTFYSSFRLLFLAIVIAALLLGSAMLYNIDTTWKIFNISGISFVGFTIAAVLGITAFFESFRG